MYLIIILICLKKCVLDAFYLLIFGLSWIVCGICICAIAASPNCYYNLEFTVFHFQVQKNNYRYLTILFSSVYSCHKSLLETQCSADGRFSREADTRKRFS